MKIKMTSGLPEEGEHEARFIGDCVVKNAKGNLSFFEFEITKGKDKGCTVRALVGTLSGKALNIKPWHRSARWVAALVGHDFKDEEIDTDGLVNTPCVITVKHKAKNGKTYADVVEVKTTIDRR